MIEPVHPLIDHPLPGVCRLTLNRADKRNALNNTLRGEIFSARECDDRDPDLRLTVIRGAGPAFCSGYDLPADDTVGQPHHSAGGLGQWSRHVVDGWFRIWDLAKPVIAQVHGYCLAGGSELATACDLVHGYCLAGGSELATACDLVYVADDAQLGYLPVRLMSPPDMQLHPWTMGLRHAMEAMLAGDSMSRREAAERGWANRAWPADTLDAEVMKVAERMARLPPELAAINKRSVPRAMKIMGLRAAIRAGTELQALAFQTSASKAYMSRFRRDGESVSGLLSERDAAFGDYRERGE